MSRRISLGRLSKDWCWDGGPCECGDGGSSVRLDCGGDVDARGPLWCLCFFKKPKVMTVEAQLYLWAGDGRCAACC